MANRYGSISKNKKPQAHPAVLVLLPLVILSLMFIAMNNPFIAYPHIQKITNSLTIVFSIITFFYLKRKINQTPVGKPVFKGGNPKDRKVYIYLLPLCSLVGIYMFLVMCLSALSFLSYQDFKSHIIVDKEHTERSTGSRGSNCTRGNYEISETLHFKMQFFLKICLDKKIYDQMPDIAVLNVSGKKSFLGHRIQKISYSPEKQKDVGIIFESIKKEWQPFEP